MTQRVVRKFRDSLFTLGRLLLLYTTTNNDYCGERPPPGQRKIIALKAPENKTLTVVTVKGN